MCLKLCVDVNWTWTWTLPKHTKQIMFRLLADLWRQNLNKRKKLKKYGKMLMITNKITKLRIKSFIKIFNDYSKLL